MSWLGRELRGFWRSVHYDVTRPVPLSRRRTEVLHPEYDAYQRAPRRRYLGAFGLGLGAAMFVVATFFGVTAGLGNVLSTTPDTAANPPETEATSPGTTGGPTTAAVGAPHTRGAVPPSKHPAAVPGTAVPAVAAAPSCLCPVPPVPTPEASSVSPSHSPSPTPSPSVSVSASPSPSGTGTGR